LTKRAGNGTVCILEQKQKSDKGLQIISGKCAKKLNKEGTFNIEV